VTACLSIHVDAKKSFSVNKFMKETFPCVTVWHCVNYKLELLVSDAINAVLEIKSFKSFIDKLYVLYHASPKNSNYM
jgi:hypothetical protein